MGYDDVLDKLGGFGHYQKRIYFLICLPAIPCAFHKLVSVFLLAKPDFRCELPFENESVAEYQLPKNYWNLSYPVDAFTQKHSQCQYYDANYTEEYLDGNEAAGNIIFCNKYIYDTSTYDNTALTEWNLVCDKSWLVATTDSIFMLGVLIGSIVFGHMSDVYGRKPIFFASLVAQVIFGVLAGIAPEYVTFTITRFIVGATTSGVFLVAYVIAMEMVGPSYRLFAGVVCMMFFSLGFMLLAGFAYLIHDWRWLQIAVTLPGLVFISYHWFIPESARWLLSKGKKESAKEIIRNAAKENKVEISDDLLDNLLEDDVVKKQAGPTDRNSSVFDLLRYPNLRRKSLLIFFDWFVNSGTYYALSWNTNNLGGNAIINFIISGAVEIPAYSFLLVTLNRWGRRSILCGCMITSGVMLLATSCIPDNYNWLIITLAMLGKLAITSSYGTIYVFSVEQFPTVVRNVALGAASMFARVGGICAPYINLTGTFWRPLPMIICGAMAFLGGLLSLYLPETHNKPLLETIEDGENFGKKKMNENPTSGQELSLFNETKANGETKTDIKNNEANELAPLNESERSQNENRKFNVNTT